MKVQINIFNNDKAASPVIGVMLMVVVTVILAAAVNSNAVSFFTGTETVPSASFEVRIDKDVPIDGDKISSLIIKETTGATINTEDLKIITYNEKAENPLKETYPNIKNTDINIDGDSIEGVSPYWNNPGIGDFGSESVDFGNYSLKPGVVMVADSSEEWIDNGVTGLEALIREWDEVSKGDFITITIVHVPSGKVLFDSEVVVS